MEEMAISHPLKNYIIGCDSWPLVSISGNTHEAMKTYEYYEFLQPDVWSHLEVENLTKISRPYMLEEIVSDRLFAFTLSVQSTHLTYALFICKCTVCREGYALLLEQVGVKHALVIWWNTPTTILPPPPFLHLYSPVVCQPQPPYPLHRKCTDMPHVLEGGWGVDMLGWGGESGKWIQTLNSLTCLPI